MKQAIGRKLLFGLGIAVVVAVAVAIVRRLLDRAAAPDSESWVGLMMQWST